MNPERLGCVPERVPTVIVVDDDTNVRRVSTVMVKRMGYEAISATNGLEALETMEARHVDLVLCDMKMPGYDGEWLLAHMRERHAAIPVVVVTGLGELEPSISLAPNIIGYLVKPFQRAALESILRGALSPISA